MFSIFGNKEPKPVGLEQLKKHTKVLIIDDEEPKDLREFLKREGWKTNYLEDLDAFTNRKLVESQIICIDIMGVGKKLHVENGMELVKCIKDRYPEKKVILYSSVSKQDIFSDAIDFVDRRLRKESSLVPFVTAIQEMSEMTFSWDKTVEYAFEKFKELQETGMTLDEFKKSIQKTQTKNGIDNKKLGKSLGVGLDISSKIASLLALILAA